MNLSPEMLERFERLYVEEQAFYWEGKPYPQELKDAELRDQYMDWRTDTKDAPLELAAAEHVRDHLAKQREAKEAQQAQENVQAAEAQQT